MVDRSRKERAAWAWRAPLLALSLGIAIGVSARGWAAPAGPDVPATRPQDRAIFDAGATRKSSGLVDALAKAEAWTPTLADVLALEQKLPGHLRENYESRRKEPLWKRAPGYKRQYLGITRQGRRVIHANLFCQVPGSRVSDWHTVAVVVEDGGDCYFSIEYDVQRGTFRDLRVNGEA
jgi:hypothetical protein